MSNSQTPQDGSTDIVSENQKNSDSQKIISLLESQESTGEIKVPGNSQIDCVAAYLRKRICPDSEINDERPSKEMATEIQKEVINIDVPEISPEKKIDWDNDFTIKTSDDDVLIMTQDKLLMFVPKKILSTCYHGVPRNYNNQRLTMPYTLSALKIWFHYLKNLDESDSFREKHILSRIKFGSDLRDLVDLAKDWYHVKIIYLLDDYFSSRERLLPICGDILICMLLKYHGPVREPSVSVMNPSVQPNVVLDPNFKLPKIKKTFDSIFVDDPKKLYLFDFKKMTSTNVEYLSILSWGTYIQCFELWLDCQNTIINENILRSNGFSMMTFQTIPTQFIARLTTILKRLNGVDKFKIRVYEEIGFNYVKHINCHCTQK